MASVPIRVFIDSQPFKNKGLYWQWYTLDQSVVAYSPYVGDILIVRCLDGFELFLPDLGYGPEDSPNPFTCGSYRVMIDWIRQNCTTS